jgi:hypothetical protein
MNRFLCFRRASLDDATELDHKELERAGPIRVCFTADARFLCRDAIMPRKHHSRYDAG